VLDIAAPSVGGAPVKEVPVVPVVDAAELLTLLAPRAQRFVAGGSGADVPGTIALLRALQVRSISTYVGVRGLASL
jgi:hypothetical protein